MITVIKLGGSLLNSGSLIDCMTTVTRLPGQKIIVPGGGLFADQVRLAQTCWQFDDRTAHQMAILAMQQMALLLAGLPPRFAVICQTHQFDSGIPVSIWSPDIAELDAHEIASNWQVTSDSLSAWLAGHLAAARLFLVKSAPVDPQLSLSQLQEQGIIDAAFTEFTPSLNTTAVRVINHEQFQQLL